MGKIQRNKSGFSVVEALLVLVIVSILGFTGWFVWHTKQAADMNLASSASNNTSAVTKKVATKTPATTQTTGPYAGWQTYNLTTEGATIKYPAGWKLSVTNVPASNGLGAVTYATITSPTSASVQAIDGTSGKPTTAPASNMSVRINYGGIPRQTVGGNDYIVKSNPLALENYKKVSIIEEGCLVENCVSDLAISDAAVRVGKNVIPDASYASRQNNKMEVNVTAGLYYNNPTGSGGYISMNPTTFEGLQDYTIALNVLKSLSYVH